MWTGRNEAMEYQNVQKIKKLVKMEYNYMIKIEFNLCDRKSSTNDYIYFTYYN